MPEKLEYREIQAQEDFPEYHTHWTPLIVPEPPSLRVEAATGP